MNLLISWTNADLRYWIGLLICLDIHMDVCLDLRLSSLLSSFSMEQTAFLPIIYSSGAIQKIMWKLNKSIAKELLPTQPVDFAIEPWWGVCLVNFTLEEFKVRSFKIWKVLAQNHSFAFFFLSMISALFVFAFETASGAFQKCVWLEKASNWCFFSVFR